MPLRRSTKERRSTIPDDYIVFLQEHKVDISVAEDDPINFRQAIESSNSKKWIDAMNEDIKSMKDNDVWDLVPLPKGRKPIGCKWIFKTKKDSMGNVERYKVCLVAKGFTQKEGIDQRETFSPVSLKDSFRTIMALVAHFDLELHQMDVKTAFLNGDIDETNCAAKNICVGRCKTNGLQIKEIYLWAQTDFSSMVLQISSSYHLVQF